MISERMMLKRNKAATSNLASLSLTSPTSPTLENPTRGFGIQTDTEPASANQHSLQPSIGHDISRISMRPQAKLTVNEPGEEEQEADSEVQTATHMVTPDTSSSSVPTQDTYTIQRTGGRRGKKAVAGSSTNAGNSKGTTAAASSSEETKAVAGSSTNAGNSKGTNAAVSSSEGTKAVAGSSTNAGNSKSTWAAIAAGSSTNAGNSEGTKAAVSSEGTKAVAGSSTNAGKNQPTATGHENNPKDGNQKTVKKEPDLPLSEVNNEKWLQAWTDKQKEVHDAMQAFVPRFQALDTDAEVKIRGSLASGIKGPNKVDKTGQRLLFNPTDFDIDAYVVSEKLFKEAVKKDPNAAARGQIAGSKHDQVNAIIGEMRIVLAKISGNRDVPPTEWKFNVLIRSRKNAAGTVKRDQKAMEELRFPGEWGNPLEVKPPKK
ncbi:hypothetical protein NIES4071_85910 [Calothrix sp. NIES-4071]|nr:hypothetical protein NIES4071_85910 [Calothrix sp. NIES-4071]BAZ62858.1 hypothetical protein NIES4105_85840 [Calothrix sp. NIES-4105]